MGLDFDPDPQKVCYWLIQDWKYGKKQILLICPQIYPTHQLPWEKKHLPQFQTHYFLIDYEDA